MNANENFTMMIYKLKNKGDGFFFSTDKKPKAQDKLFASIATTNEKVKIDYLLPLVKLKTIQVLPHGKYAADKIEVGLIAFPDSLELFFCNPAGFLNPEKLIHKTDFFTLNIEAE